MSTIPEALIKLNQSSFRAKFHLSDRDRAYVRRKGIERIRVHCEDFVKERLAPERRKADSDERSSRVYCTARVCMLLSGLS